MQKTKPVDVFVTFLVCFAFWILLTWDFSIQELAGGAVVSLLVAFFSARYFIHKKAGWLLNPGKFFSMLGFWLGTFPVELVKANVDMAKRCFGGCKDINPGIVKIPVGMKSLYGQAALANSITLTPGTITLDIAEQDGETYYYVHWIDVSAPSGEEAGEAIKGNLERGLRRVWE
ncbi:MAG: Na+/H+ antiporter subunit E [Oscillospiraceae bacterium]|nr:Na+/H+ antiporter subunit E [Oscillospiraceae bacterium]